MGERSYTNLREHIQALEANGLLVRVKRKINKDTELHPLSLCGLNQVRSAR